MMIDKIYKYLCSLYNLEPKHIPSNFLMNHVPKNLIGIGDRFNREAVFAVKRADSWNIGIYINPEILNRINNGENNSVDDICCAIEGVSHFIYLLNHIEKHQKCSMLELELQAEVDKFVVLSASARFKPYFVKKHFEELFDSPEFSNELSQTELIRYKDANALALQYCLELKDMIFAKNIQTMKKMCKSFFKSDIKNKLARIHTA